MTCRLHNLLSPRFLPITFAALLATLLLAGCNSPQTLAERAEKHIQLYAESPSAATAAKAEESLAALDAAITTLENKGHDQEAERWRHQWATLHARYEAAKAAAAVRQAAEALKHLGDAVRDAGRDLGEIFKPRDPQE